jgi:hypothetical protein
MGKRKESSNSESAGVIDGMLEDLVESGEANQMEGLDIARLKAAMSAPGAAETVAEIQAMGADSRAAAGQPAPDFELPFLTGQDRSQGETIRLSDRFPNRPVALVFGSYT